jgi:Dimerisation domain/PEP-CTERM motif
MRHVANSRVKRLSPSRPYDAVFQMVIGKLISQALGTVVEMGIPDQLAKGARQCSDMAREAGVSEDALYRVLRALASVGLFAESANRRFRLTGMGQLLRSDHPNSLAGYARFTAHDITWRPWTLTWTVTVSSLASPLVQSLVIDGCSGIPCTFGHFFQLPLVNKPTSGTLKVDINGQSQIYPFRYISSAPEPASLVLLGTGLIAVACRKFRTTAS